MRPYDGRCECPHCGQVFDIPRAADVEVTIRASGGHPNVRVVTLHGAEIHRCAIGAIGPERLRRPEPVCRSSDAVVDHPTV